MKIKNMIKISALAACIGLTGNAWAATPYYNQEINLFNNNYIGDFGDYLPGVPGIEHSVQFQRVAFDSIAINKLAQQEQTGQLPPVNPKTGQYVTPVKGRVGISSGFRMYNAANKPVGKPIIITHLYNVTVRFPWDATNLTQSGNSENGGKIIVGGKPYPIMMSNIVYTEPDAVTQGQFSGQAKVSVVNPATGKVVNHIFRSFGPWHLDPERVHLIDTNGDGNDEIVVEYRRNTRALPNGNISQRLTRVIHPLTKKVMRQQVAGSRWAIVIR